jgi:hypothetical protein
MRVLNLVCSSVKALTSGLDAPSMVDGARAAMSLRDEITVRPIPLSIHVISLVL